jgi:signal transduction histidine kinase/sugar lactone lactonase YvrE
VQDVDLPNVGILAIEEGLDGTRWLGTPNGLYRISGSERKLFTISDGLTNNTIRDIHEDRSGDVWVATDFGVSRIRRDGRIERFAGRAGLGTAYAIAIAESPDGRIWVATGAGLGEFDGHAFKLHSAPGALPSNRLFAIHADAGNTIWLATDGDGLIRFRNGKASAITTRHGLASNKIVSFTEDGQGRFWFGTVRGVFTAIRRELNAVADGASTHAVSKIYDETDGLGSRQTNGAANPAALRTRDGKIWIATAKGISALMNAQPPLPLRAPVVERVSINGKAVEPDALRTIEPGLERIELTYSGVTFVAPERMHFRYRLEGYDEAWIDGSASRVASYTKLPAGDYQFVLASSRDGWQWRTTTAAFRLQPRFYETRWFIIVSVLAGIALLLALHTMRLHFSRERARRLEKVVEERTRQISEEKERTEVALREAEAAKLEAEAAKREAEHHEQMVEQALTQAESASRTKSIFLATTSHELRTPLNAIIGFSEILIENAADRLEPRHVRFLQNILSSGEYLLGHINNILDLSKIEAGRLELQPETLLLHDVVDEISAVMKGVATLRRVSIDVNLSENLPSLEADPTQIKQILYNLISNAVKFSPEGSVVTLSMRHLSDEESPIRESAIEIRVSDQGIGIDPKDHHLIFQEFRQAHGARGERPQGTGLGLALVKRFVEMHHGTIRVESALGSGSTFIVVLPRKHAVATHATTALRGLA